MATYYVDSNTSSLWVASQVVALGARRVCTTAAASAARGYVRECTTAGTCAATEPVWTNVPGDTLADGTAVWTTREASTIANASAFLYYLHNHRAAAGDKIWLRTTHSEITADAIAFNDIGAASSPVQWLCAGTWTNNPGTTGIGAVIATSTFNNILSYGFRYIVGLEFSAGSGPSDAHIALASGGIRGMHFLKDCILRLNNTGPSSTLFLGSSTAVGSDVRLTNTKVAFGEIGQSIKARGRLVWQATPATILGTVVPTVLINMVEGTYCDVDISGLGLTALVTGKSLFGVTVPVAGRMAARNSSLGVGGALTSGTIPGTDGAVVIADNVTSGAINYSEYKQTYEGVLTQETDILKTGGSSNGTTAISCKMDSSANAKFYAPLYSRWMLIWIDTTAVSKTITLDLIHNSITALTDADVWAEVGYLSSATLPIETTVSDAALSIAATPANQDASTAAWDGATITARANSVAYVVGNIYKVAANAGRIFFCTVAGTSAAAEPAGLATAADGGEVVDGTATFRSGFRHRLISPPFTTQMKGYAMARVALAKPSYTAYIDGHPQVA